MAIWPRWQIQHSLLCIDSYITSIIHLACFFLEMGGHRIPLLCLLSRRVRMAEQPPFTTSTTMTFQQPQWAIVLWAGWGKTATVGGREQWMMRLASREVGWVGERKAVRRSKTPPQIHSRGRCGLNGCLMISSPRLCVVRSAGSLLWAGELQLCVGKAADRPESSPCHGERARQKGTRVHSGKGFVPRVKLLSLKVYKFTLCS